MADGITVPSPSVFLRKTPSPPAPSEHSQPDSRPRHARKTSRTSKAPSKKADDAVAAPTQKPKQSKSRNGCSTCKAKRLKCDEQKPGCLQCAKRKVQCGGYKKDFKWRPFEETNVKINIDRHQKVTPPQAQSSGASQTTTPVSEHPPGLTNDPPSQIKQNHGLAARAEGSITSSQRASPSNNTDNHSHSHSAADHTQDQEPTGGLSEALLSISTLATSDDALHTTPQVDPPQLSAELPATFEGLSPISPLGLPNPPTDDFDVDPFGLIMPQSDVQATVNDEDIEQILQDEMTVSNNVWLPQSRNDSFNGIAGTATDFLWQGPVDYLYSQPSFAEDSPEMLCFRFDKLTCGILSVMDGAVENPWRSLVFPMAQSSPALYHAVMSMTAFHSSKDVPGLRLTGQEHKQASLTYIQEGIRDSSMTDQTAIATALALGFCESWDRHTKSGNTHIKGAQVLVKRALANHQRNPLQGIELARMKFLCNAWVYMDVIARLTSVDSDESNDFDNPFLFNLVSASPLTGQDEQPGFGIDFGMPIDARLDPLMGCAGTLFPLIGRVANLVRKVCRSQSNSAPVISQANDLKLALETWEPPAFIEPPEDPTSQVLHALQTAEAYRWATLLHLHQSVPELPSMDSSELAQKVLTYLATVPLASRTVIVQIYPLMVAGCEASTSEDRQWVRDRWTAMLTRMRIGVVDKCAVVTEEVWRRKDTYEAQPTTKRKLVATAALQQSRKRSERPHDGCQDSSPGHTGMVFSWAEDEGEVTREEKSFWPPNVRDKAKSAIGSMDSAYTVRGHCHWVGVMWDWGWEVLLG